MGITSGKVPAVGPLHEQAIAISSQATGEQSELEQLQQLAEEATGNEAELIGWQIESWQLRFGASNLDLELPE